MFGVMELLLGLVLLLFGFFIGFAYAKRLAFAERTKLEQACLDERAESEALKQTVLDKQQQLAELKYQYGQLKRDYQAQQSMQKIP